MSCFPQPPKNKEYLFIVGKPLPDHRTPKPSHKKAPSRVQLRFFSRAAIGWNRDIDHESERGTLMNVDCC
jgi:hypothetical protein